MKKTVLVLSVVILALVATTLTIMASGAAPETKYPTMVLQPVKRAAETDAQKKTGPKKQAPAAKEVKKGVAPKYIRDDVDEILQKNQLQVSSKASYYWPADSSGSASLNVGLFYEGYNVNSELQKALKILIKELFESYGDAKSMIITTSPGEAGGGVSVFWISRGTYANDKAAWDKIDPSEIHKFFGENSEISDYYLTGKLAEKKPSMTKEEALKLHNESYNKK